MTVTICRPDLSIRPFALTVERAMTAPPATLFDAWTDRLDRWLAAPGTLLLRAAVNAPFYFEAHAGGTRYPHYGRFLQLERDRLVELTWVTPATKGAETVVTVELAPDGGGTRLRLTQAGFPDEASRDEYRTAWPGVLGELDRRVTDPAVAVE